MLKINENFSSFKEFYLLEEGIGSSIIEKFNQLKKEIMTKDLDGNPINTKKIKSLEQEIFELLKALGRLNKDVLKRFAYMIIGDPLIKMNKKVGGLRIGFWVAAIIHLLAIYGLRSIGDTKDIRHSNKEFKNLNQQQIVQKQSPTL